MTTTALGGPVTLVEATSPNLETIPKIGASVKTKPTFNVTTGAPAYFDNNDGGLHWQKKVDGEWQYAATSGNFTPGFWRYRCLVRLDETVDPYHEYVFEDDVTVMVNGTEWEKESVGNFETDSYVIVYSPEFYLSQTEISLVEATSTNLTPKIGMSVQNFPTFNVTNDVPAYFSESGCWQKKVDNGWQNVTSGNFTPGTWRYQGQVRIDETTDPDHLYYLNDNVEVRVNGTEWGKGNHTSETTASGFRKYSYIPVFSPEIQLRTEISLVEATSPNLTTIPKLGASVETDPTFNVTSTTKAYFLVEGGNGQWQKYVDGEWQYAYGNFTEGLWRYRCQVRIDETTDPDHKYVLSKYVKVKVNGTDWKRGDVDVWETGSLVYITSPEITVGKNEISLVEATSPDWNTIPVVGESRTTHPTFIINTGYPAYFSSNDYCYWERKDENGTWWAKNSGDFIEGTWRYVCELRIDETTDPDNQYVFSGDVKVMINGAEWETKIRVIAETYSAISIYSPEIIVGKRAVSLVAATSTNLTTIPKVGDRVLRQPTFDRTAGYPAYFNASNGIGKWQQKVGSQWQDVTSGYFSAGTWRYACQVRIDETTDPDNMYVLADDVRVKVNGAEWEKDATEVYDTYSCVSVYSPAINVTGDNVISLVEALSTDFTEIPQVGNSVATMPDFSVTTGAPAYFLVHSANGQWQKKVGGQWQTLYSGSFTTGTWRFTCQVRIDETTDPSHQYSLAKNVTVKVNGQEWQREMVNVYSDLSYVFVTSPEITITRKEISLVEATCLNLRAYLGGNVEIYNRSPKFTVTTGAPAYFLMNEFNNGNWQKKVDGQWQNVFEGQFTEGSWRYRCHVRIDEKTDPDNQYVLADDVAVWVNGEKWETDRHGTIGDTYSYVSVYSPELILFETTAIRLVKATTTDLMTIPAIGVPVNTKPTFEVTHGEPAFFNVNAGNGKWLKKVDGKWQSVNSGSFTAGTWRFSCQVRIDSSTDPEHRYYLDDKVRIWVNEKQWETDYFLKGETYSAITVYSPEITLERTGTMGERGFWSFANGVLTVDYDGAMPFSSQTEEDPNVAFRLQWIDFLGEIDEVVITGQDVEIQPFFLYYEGNGNLGQHPDDHITKITLGSGVKRIGNQALAVYDLKDLYCYCEILPILASYSGANQKCFWEQRVKANNARLHVLPGTEIRTDSEWELFNIVTDLDPEDDPVGIKEIKNESLTPALSRGEGDWFDLSGRKLSGKPTKSGLYIVGGKKVLVK